MTTIEQDIKREIDRKYNGRRLKTTNFLIAGALLFGAWAYTGFMGPDTLLNGLTAKSECVDFAKRKNVFKEGHEIKAVGMRIRSGKWVYDLVANAPGSKELESRTCVVDGNTIRIVSLLESGFWR
jgi:hypothetical protein